LAHKILTSGNGFLLENMLNCAGEDEEPDFTYMYMLLDFLKEGKKEPILCGYFAKIILFMVEREKAKTLEFLLYETNGLIFDRLLDNFDDYSLVTLLQNLIKIRCAKEDFKDEGIFIVANQTMKTKKNLVVEKLIDNLKKSGSLENALNTKTVLAEMAVNGFKAVLAN